MKVLTQATHFFLWILLAMLASGCGTDSPAQQETTDSPGRKTVFVTTVPVEASNIADTFTLPGTLEAWEDLDLAAEIAGSVRYIGFDEGERVQRGEVIMKIDPEARQADLQKAQAEFEVQRNQLERMTRLLDENIISPQEFEDARSQFEVARAALRNAEVALEKSNITSPVSGVVDRLLVDRGEYVAPGTPVAEVVQVDRLQAVVEVPEKDVPFIQVGEKVEVIPALVSGDNVTPRPGEVIYLAYKADPVTRTYRAKVEVDNKDGRLRPGMILRVRFTREEMRQVVAIPLYAVIDSEGDKIVFVEKDGVAHVRPVVLGPVVGDRVIVAEGLVPGENLIIKGQQLLEEGSAVAVGTD